MHGFPSIRESSSELYTSIKATVFILAPSKKLCRGMRSSLLFKIPPPLPKIFSEVINFLHTSVRNSLAILYHHRFFVIHFLNPDNVFLFEKELEHSRHLLMFQLVKESFVFWSVMFWRKKLCSRGQVLYSPHHVQLLKNVLMNRTSDCGLMNCIFHRFSST